MADVVHELEPGGPLRLQGAFFDFGKVALTCGVLVQGDKAGGELIPVDVQVEQGVLRS